MISANNAMLPRLFYIDVEVDSVPRARGEPLQSITQIAVCDPSRPENERYFVKFVQPNKLVSQKSKAHEGSAKTAKKFKHVWEKLENWVNSRLDGNRQALFVGHNIYAHDWKILGNECTRIGKALPKFWKPFDTLYLAGMLYGKGGNSQVELCHRLGVEVLKAHDALNDVKMLEGVFKAMVGDAKMDKVLKAAILPPEDHPVVSVAKIIDKHKQAVLIFYDFETTGLFADKKNPDRPNPRAVELAAYIPSINKSFSTLINPGIPIPEEAMNIHGITNEMVQGQPNFKAAWLAFEDFINTQVGATANKVNVLIGHNVWGYDDKVAQAERERTNTPIKTYKSLDTLAVARVMCKGGKRMSHKLQDWRVRLGIEENQAHRAAGDVMVNAQVWAKWVEGIPQKDLNKAILSGHPAKGVALLISEKGAFNPNDYKDEKNSVGKREREEPEVEFSDKKQKEELDDVVEVKQEVKKAKVKKVKQEVLVMEPVAPVIIQQPAVIESELMEDDQESEFEFVFNSNMEIE